MGEAAPPVTAPGVALRTLSTGQKLVYASGDHTVNLSLSALALFYLYFLTEVAGLRPALAGAVPLVGRVVDACFDPVMGRISDQTRTRWGRRRPYFLLGALPFGLTFAWMWSEAPFGSQGAIAPSGVTSCMLSTRGGSGSMSTVAVAEKIGVWRAVQVAPAITVRTKTVSTSQRCLRSARR